jgi:hypothetical protein
VFIQILPNFFFNCRVTYLVIFIEKNSQKILKKDRRILV